MSLKGIVEIVLHVESFRNIDLFQQGFYYLQFEIFHMENNKKVSASPYNHVVGMTDVKTIKLPGGVEDIFYKSQCFYIKFFEEEVELKEIAVFRTEVDLRSGKCPDLTMVCCLMYGDVGGRVNEKYLRHSGTIIKEYRQESFLSIQIRDYAEGLNQFFPIIFDDSHFCLVTSTIHIFLIDFRYRALKPLPDTLTKDANEDSSDIPEVLSESFFPCSDDLSLSLVNYIHNLYTRPLNISQIRSSLLINQLKKLIESAEVLSPEDLAILSNDSIEALLLPNSHESFNHEKEEFDPVKVTKRLLDEIQMISSNLHYVLFDFIETLLVVSKKASVSMMLVYNHEVKQRWGESIFKKVTQVGSFTEFAEDNLKHLHKMAAKALRKSGHYKNKEKPKVGTDKYFPGFDIHPILFLDIYSRVPYVESEWKPSMVKFCIHSKVRPKHLIVLVHGFQGSSFDVRLIKNQIALLRPDTILMSSHMNEGETEGDILQMGERLAEEVTQFIQDHCPKNSIEFISFVGHSLGGLIIRASLPYMKQISHLFHFFISFSSPHLGYMHNSSKLVGAGMWILKKLKKTESLQQLSMNDASDPKKSLLFALSSADGLGWFKYIGLVGAHQDNYAPFESARIEVQHKVSKDTKGRVNVEMATNILSRVRAEQILRIDCNLNFKKKNLDSMIGRAAHIQMLDNHVLIQMVFDCCIHFFDV